MKIQKLGHVLDFKTFQMKLDKLYLTLETLRKSVTEQTIISDFRDKNQVAFIHRRIEKYSNVLNKHKTFNPLQRLNISQTI